MRKILYLFFFVSFFSFAQSENDKIIYLDSLYREVPKEKLFYTKVVKDYFLKKSEYKHLIYYKNGNLESEKTYASNEEYAVATGEAVSYYENGNKKSVVWYEENKLKGKSTQWYKSGRIKEEGEYIAGNTNFPTYKIVSFWKESGEKTVIDGNGIYDYTDEKESEKGNYLNGFKDGNWTGQDLILNMSYSETYHNGEFVSGESINYSDDSLTKYTEVKLLPKPKKGIEHFYKFIENNFELTRESIRNNIHGKILVSFTVQKDGSLGDIEIRKGLGYGLDEEAIRVMKEYGKWIPAKQRGRIVKCSFMIPIRL